VKSPAVPVPDYFILPPVTPVGNCEPGALMKVSRADDEGVRQIAAHDQICIAPRVRRFLNAYLDADKSRRADFRKAVAYASQRVEFDSPAPSTLEGDIATARVIAQKAADIADATDIDETVDGLGSYSADSDLLLLADAFAALAFVYRYVVGFYVSDATLDDLGEVAVRFVLLAEGEFNWALAATTAAFPVTSLITNNGCRVEFESALSMFVPAMAGQADGAASSRVIVSPRPKEPLLLMA
jgi:hypothetical protein